MNKNFREKIDFFLAHPLMFIHSLEKEQVVAFINGFEFGTSDEFLLIERIKKYIEEKHGLLGGALGWPNQVHLLATKKGVSWFEAFKSTVENIIEAE